MQLDTQHSAGNERAQIIDRNVVDLVPARRAAV